MPKYLLWIGLVALAVIAYLGYKNIYPFLDSSQRLVDIPKVTTEITPSTTIADQSKISVVAENLDVPWAIVFLPDQKMLVTERIGLVRLISLNGSQNEVIATINEVKQTGEGGLHGITLHPNFNDNHWVYLYYTYASSGDDTLNRVVQYTFEDNKLTKPKTVVDQIPGALFHDGGRIKFGPDKFLYISTGDAQNPSLAQNKDSLAGKILRVFDLGKPAADNPFNTQVFSLGHRNPQGLAWDDKNNLYITEHGQSSTDELNKVEAGKNYGWPTIRGDQKQQGLESPLLQSGSDTWAPSGMAYINGSLYWGGLRGQALYQYNLQTKEFKTHFKGQIGRIREVIVGPDNLLYISTSNRDGRGTVSQNDDKIYRINPAKL